jgi:hypothetical protein
MLPEIGTKLYFNGKEHTCIRHEACPPTGMCAILEYETDVEINGEAKWHFAMSKERYVNRHETGWRDEPDEHTGN